jgi:hypothetical protein
MASMIYPDAATAAMLGIPAAAPLLLRSNAAMGAFAPLAPLVGPDPDLGNVPTTFIRVALSGAPVPSNRHPRIELLAHHPEAPNGSPAPALDPNTATTIAAAVPLFDDVNPTGAALAYFAPPFVDNVYLLKVVIQIEATRLWIRIANTTGMDRNVVWVVADNEADTRQPWIHATHRNAVPAHIQFDAVAGQTLAQPIEITNRGTGAFTAKGVTPPLTAPYTISGLPVTIGPNPSPSASVQVAFNAPSTAGEMPPAAFAFVTADKPDPGPFGAGHNNQFILSARTRPAAPSFAPSPNQFDPKRGRAGMTVQLRGNNFAEPVSVRFGPVAATIVSATASQITTTVPDMSAGSVKIAVQTRNGSTTSTDDFLVPGRPNIFYAGNGTTRTTGGPLPFRGVFYRVADDGNLLWYRYLGEGGSQASDWDPNSGNAIGRGWNGAKHLLGCGNGVILAVQQNGDLLWYRYQGNGEHDPTGSTGWHENSGNPIGNGWHGFHDLIVFPRAGRLLARPLRLLVVAANGDLLWYSYSGSGESDITGATGWHENSGNPIGNGWQNLRHMHGSGNVIFAVAQNGDLLWYRYEGGGEADVSGATGWNANSGNPIGNGWQGQLQLFGGITDAGGPGHVIYSVTPTGDLLWHRYNGNGEADQSGHLGWVDNSGSRIREGF